MQSKLSKRKPHSAYRDRKVKDKPLSPNRHFSHDPADRKSKGKKDNKGLVINASNEGRFDYYPLINTRQDLIESTRVSQRLINGAFKPTERSMQDTNAQESNACSTEASKLLLSIDSGSRTLAHRSNVPASCKAFQNTLITPTSSFGNMLNCKP